MYIYLPDWNKQIRNKENLNASWVAIPNNMSKTLRFKDFNYVDIYVYMHLFVEKSNNDFADKYMDYAPDFFRKNAKISLKKFKKSIEKLIKHQIIHLIESPKEIEIIENEKKIGSSKSKRKEEIRRDEIKKELEGQEGKEVGQEIMEGVFNHIGKYL